MAYGEKYKRILGRMGYYGYQQGLIYRHLNQEEGWNRHLENCRNFILKSLAFHKPEKVTVLGSGWLLDLPLSEILEKKISVTLIDIVHPPEAVKQITGLGNVEMIEMDVTGGVIEMVWNTAGKSLFFKKPVDLAKTEIPDFELPFEPGMVISLNILSQLDVLPVELLMKKTTAGKNELMAFRSIMQKKHMDFLARHKSVLITDICEKFTLRSGDTTDLQSVVIDLPAGRYREEWKWDFDLKRSDYYDKSSVMEVVAIIL